MDGNFKVYKRRWIILVIFCLTTGLNAAHWVQYAIINNIVSRYYEVSPTLVDWTVMVYSVIYILLIFPATWFMETRGLRLAINIALGLMTAGSWLKLLSVERNMFAVAFVGQTLIGIAQVFVFCVPSRLASLWFPTKSVSIVCAIGVVGNEIGTAFSFYLPPLIVKNSETLSEIKGDFMILHIGMAVPSTVLLILAIIFFQKAPPLPPDLAQFTANERNVGLTYLTTLKSLATNKDYILLVITYSMNVSVYYTYSTLLNKMLLRHYPTGEEDGGRIGAALITGGIAGTLILGYVLDKTGWYKQISIFTYAMALIGISGFTLSLYLEYLVFVYVSSCFLGMFMSGYLAVSFEFSAELTYPLPESTSVGVLTCFGEGISMAFILAGGAIEKKHGDLPTNVMLIAANLVGFFTVLWIDGDHLLRRIVVERKSSRSVMRRI